MIGNFIVNRIKDTILKTLMLSGNVSNSQLLKNIRSAISQSGSSISIFKPEYYKYMQTNTSPKIWNKTMLSIDGDFHAMEDAIVYMQQTESDMVETTQVELESLKNRISALELLTNMTDPSVENVISIIPNYVDNEAEKTTCRIVENKRMAYPGNILDIYQHIIAPNNITFTLDGKYSSYTVLGDITNIVKNNNAEYKIIISATEPAQQTVTFRLQLGADADGIHISAVPNGSYYVTSNITTSPFAVYDDLLLTSGSVTFNDVSVSFTTDTYDRIQNGSYIYTFCIKGLVPFLSQYHDVGLLTSTELTTKEPVLNLNGSYSGTVIAQIAVDSGEFYNVDFGKDVEISSLLTVDTGVKYINDNGNLVTLSTVSTTMIGVSIIGPYNCCQQIGENSYKTTLKVITTGTIIFNFNGYILINGIRYNVAIGDVKILSPGEYVLVSSSFGAFINSASTASYEIYVLNKYTRIISDYTTNILDYPPYTYMFIEQDIDGETTTLLGLSGSSLLGLYGCVSGFTSAVNATQAAELLKVQYYDQAQKTIVVRFIVSKNSALNNPRIVFKGGS